MDKKMSVVELEEKHLLKVAKIEADNFSEPWSYEAIKGTIGNPLYNFYCLVDNEEELYGYVGMSTCAPESEIVSVAIDDRYKGQGLSKVVLNAAIEFEKKKGIEKIFLEVRESNSVAIHLYEKTGFVRIGRRENFYRFPNEAAIIMELSCV